MNDFNQKIINEVKLYSNSLDELLEPKYIFLKYYIENYEEFDNDVEIIKEEFEYTESNVDGYYYDIDNQICYLYVSNFNDTLDEHSIITKDEVEIEYSKIIKFVENSYNKKFTKYSNDSLTFDLASEIYKEKTKYDVIINFVTNYNVPSSIRRDGIITINNTNVRINTIDLSDLKTKLSSNILSSSIIDCNSLFGQKLNALLISSNEHSDIYMLYMKGIWLATMYKEDGPRLLEANCRSYLKRTAKVNKGIMTTVKETPELFVSYNNGLSACSTKVKVINKNNDSCIISSIENLQIVNGGQTTATLAECLKDGFDKELEIVKVPVKLSVIKNAVNANEIIGNISTYSNTQTAIKKSDPPSNNPYFIKMKQLSNICLSVDKKENHYICYFERTAGEYQTEIRRNNGSKKFLKRSPKEYKFNKLEMALGINSWQQLPYLVSAGGEKNFSYLNEQVSKQCSNYDEVYFKKMYATIILFRNIDKIAKKMKITYKRNVVTYTCSLLSYLTNYSLDLIAIWDNKCIDKKLIDVVNCIIPKVHSCIINSPSDCPEPRMWARKEKLWDIIKNINCDISGLSLVEKTDFYPIDPNVQFSNIDRNMYDGQLWRKILIWNNKVQILNTYELNMLNGHKKLTFDCFDEKTKLLTTKQIEYLRKIYLKAYTNGFNKD